MKHIALVGLYITVEFENNGIESLEEQTLYHTKKLKTVKIEDSHIEINKQWIDPKED